MNILLVLVPVSLLLIGLAVWAFFWAVDNGQFDDLDTPGFRAQRPVFAQCVSRQDAAPPGGRLSPAGSKAP